MKSEQQALDALCSSVQKRAYALLAHMLVLDRQGKGRLSHRLLQEYAKTCSGVQENMLAMSLTVHLGWASATDETYPFYALTPKGRLLITTIDEASGHTPHSA